MDFKLASGKHVLAVSGGVDSMVLLDKLVKQGGSELIVAHYDHGIRQDSKEDRKLVEATAKNYRLTFEYESGNLGKKTSESDARSARYEFLMKIKDRYQADSIVTAHHQDDALETLIINIFRGTGRRGVLKESDEIKRPLLNITKAEILKYAKEHQIKWREDYTNQDTKYLRNYVRHEIVPKIRKENPKIIKQLLNSQTKLLSVNKKIDIEINRIIEENCQIKKTSISMPRQWLIMLPNEVGKEVLYESTRLLNPDISLDRKNIEGLLVFSKTAKQNRNYPLDKSLIVKSQKSKITLELV